MKPRIYSLLTALLLLAGCNNQDGVDKNQRAEEPGIIGITGPLNYVQFENLSLVYLAAAGNGDAFEEKYHSSDLQKYFNYRNQVPPDEKEAIKALISYVRTGGKDGADIAQHITTLKNQEDLTWSLPCTFYISNFSTTQFHNAPPIPLFRLSFQLEKNYFETSKLSVDQLLQNFTDLYSKKNRKIPLHQRLHLKELPSNMEIILLSADIEPSKSFTISGKCTDEGREGTYKLTGATGKSKEGYTTYFLWGTQWYKITNKNPVPAKAQEAEIFGKDVTIDCCYYSLAEGVAK